MPTNTPATFASAFALDEPAPDMRDRLSHPGALLLSLSLLAAGTAVGLLTGAPFAIVAAIVLGSSLVLVAKTIEISKIRRLQRRPQDSSDLSGIDLSTGLYNRRLFLDLLRLEISQSARHNEPLSVFVVEIVFAGAEPAEASPADWQGWITLSSWALRRCVPPEYHLGLVGPTAFGVAAPSVGAIEAIGECEQLRHRIRHELQQRTSAVTALLGSASYPVEAQNPTALLQLAERNIRGSKERSSASAGDCV